MLAFLLASAASASTPVQLSNPVFVDTFGGLTDLSTSSVDASRSGRIVGRIDLVSNQVGSNGQHILPTLAAYWRVNGTPDLPRVGTEWYGGSTHGELTLVAFDPATGEGTVEVQIGIGTLPERPRSPRLADVSGAVDFVVGWMDHLALDSNGQPEEHRWHGSVAYTSSRPSAWIEFDSPVMGTDRAMLATLRLASSPAADTTFQLTASVGGVLQLPSTVTVEVGTLGAEFTVATRGQTGRAIQLSASEPAGITATSNSLSVSASVFAMLPFEPPNIDPGSEWKFDRECNPPSYKPKPNTYYNCGRCGNVPSCPDIGIPINQVSCTFDFLEACLVGGSHQASITGPAYTKIDTVTESCGLFGNKAKTCCIYSKLGTPGTGTTDSCL